MTTPHRPDPFGGREPPAALRERITSTLVAGGLVEPRQTRLRRTILRAAALAVVFAGAFLLGRMRPGDGHGGPQFLILLYEDSLYRDDRPVREIVGEYGAWADSLRRVESLILGEKLSTDRVELASATIGDRVTQHPTGLFIIQAPDLEAATGIARTSPHLKYGGTVLVHRIDH